MSYGYVTPTGGFTVELWFSHVAIPTYPEALISQQSQNKAVATSVNADTNGRHFILYLNQTTGYLTLEMRNTAGTVVGTFADGSGGYATDSAWHHVALRVGADKKTVTLWLDGAVLYTVVLAAVLDWVPGVMAVGGTYAPDLGNYGKYLYTGGLAYFAAWDTAITDSRVLEHYTAGSGGTVFYGDTDVKRLQRLYTFAGVPVNSQVFDPSVTTLQGLQVAGQNSLEQILATASDASGTVFADGQSTMVYQNRRHRYNRFVSVTLTEMSSSSPDAGMQFTTDDTKVYNDIRASRPFGGSARIRNRASEYEYGPKLRELKLAITSDDEMRNAGTWLAERYGEDQVRINGVTLSAESSDLIQFLVETVSLGDRIAFDDMPDNVPQTYMEFIVEAISVSADFKNQTWALGLELSPADLWNVLQVSVSTLGDGSRIAY